jgi:hypothetical protein
MPSRHHTFLVVLLQSCTQTATIHLAGLVWHSLYTKVTEYRQRNQTQDCQSLASTFSRFHFRWFQYKSPAMRTADVPEDCAFYQNYPNQFNPTTVINYQLPVKSLVALKVYDVLGRAAATLVNGKQNAGHSQASFNAVDLPSGVYFYRLQAGSYSNTKKPLLLK